MPNKDIFRAAQNLVEVYNIEIDEKLRNELIQFKHFYNDYQNSKDENISRERWMYKFMLEKSLKDCFPDVEVALRMYHSLVIRNNREEKSF